MLRHIFTLTLFTIASATCLPSLAKQDFDLPGNSYLPEETLIPKELINLGHYPGYYTFPGRLVRWSEYMGVKDTKKTISPDRMSGNIYG
jgi:hypothetical protein